MKKLVALILVLVAVSAAENEIFELSESEVIELCVELCANGISSSGCDCELNLFEYTKSLFIKWWTGIDHRRQNLIRIDMDEMVENILGKEKVDNGGGGTGYGERESGGSGSSGGSGTGYGGGGNGSSGSNGGSGGSSGGGHSSNGGSGQGSGGGMSIEEKIAWLMKQDKGLALYNFVEAIKNCNPNESRVYGFLFPNGTFSHFNCSVITTTTIIPTTQEDPMVEFCKDACLNGSGGVSCNCADHPIG